jgi:hypothetical protein
MNYKISKDWRTLTITADRMERKLLREGWDNPGVTNIDSDKAMYEFLEPLVSNSELEWINPVDTGDSTSAPMLGILGDDIIARFAFMDYQVRSVLEDLRDTGKVVFVSGE